MKEMVQAFIANSCPVRMAVVFPLPVTHLLVVIVMRGFPTSGMHSLVCSVPQDDVGLWSLNRGPGAIFIGVYHTHTIESLGFRNSIKRSVSNHCYLTWTCSKKIE